MVDRSVFERRLTKLEQLLTDLRPLAEMDRAEFLANHQVQSLAERWLHLAAECCLDLANHLIADCGWSSPATNRESFQTLGRHGVLTDELAEQMVGWAGLRNVLTHLYLDIDHEILFEVLEEDLGQLESYATAVAREAFGLTGGDRS